GEDEGSGGPHPARRAGRAHAPHPRAHHPALAGGRDRRIDDGRLHLLRRYGRRVEGPASGGLHPPGGQARDGDDVHGPGAGPDCPGRRLRRQRPGPHRPVPGHVRRELRPRRRPGRGRHSRVPGPGRRTRQEGRPLPRRHRPAGTGHPELGHRSWAGFPGRYRPPAAPDARPRRPHADRAVHQRRRSVRRMSHLGRAGLEAVDPTRRGARGRV
ncbi:MAG: Transcriptional regulator, AcrR family, partial [uncultured Rubrobacteraceae bacterium]